MSRFLVVLAVPIFLCFLANYVEPRQGLLVDSYQRENCSATTYCPDGYHCCTAYTCCPYGYVCCHQGQYCCNPNEGMKKLPAPSPNRIRV